MSEINLASLSDEELIAFCFADPSLPPVAAELLSRFDTAHSIILDMKEHKRYTPPKEIRHGYDGTGSNR